AARHGPRHSPGDKGVSGTAKTGIECAKRLYHRPGSGRTKSHKGEKIMLKDITLGQFFPGNSPIHRLDPRTKLLMVVVYIIALFTAKSWLGYLILFGFLALAVKLSTISPKVLVRGMKPIVM